MLTSVLGLVAACTTFLVQDGDRIAVGKSYDWNMGQALVLTNKAGVKKRSLVFDPHAKAAEWSSEHASLTFNQYGREMPNGGINDAGLVVEIMWLEQSIYPAADDRPVLNQMQWIHYQLDRFATVADVVSHAGDLRVTSSGGKVHYLVCDASAACAAIEYVGGKLVVSDGARALTNNTYADSKAYLDQHRDRMPKSMSSLDRFARASQLAQQSRPNAPVVQRAFAILDSVHQPKYSKWNIVYEPKERRVHFRTDRTAKIKTVSLDAFQAGCDAPVQMLDIDAKEAGFSAYDPQANLRLLKQSLAGMEKELPPGAIDALAAYPSKLVCER